MSQESLIMIDECRNGRLSRHIPPYRTLSRRRKVALQRDQNEYWNEKTETLENAANNNDHAIMFREFRTLATSTTLKNNIVKDKEGNIISNYCDCINRWKEHYSELLNKGPVPHNPETSTAAANAPTDLSISEDEVTLDEVRNAVKSLKNYRAVGICKITAKLLKFGGECMLRWLQVIINCVWISETIPDDWRRGIVLPFWKRKGDRLTCANHRGITLLSIPGKLLALILLRRSVSAIRSRRCIQQAGFMPGRSTIDQIFALRQIIEKCN